MPTIPGVLETYEKLGRLHKVKNDDYAGDNGPFYNFQFAEMLSSIIKGARDKVYAVLIGIKIARLSVVLYKPPSNEAVEDTFDDMINYMTIWKADYMSRQRSNHPSEAVTIRETNKS